jgi:hypothetical protein
MEQNGNPLPVNTCASSSYQCLHRTGSKNTTIDIIFKNLIDFSGFPSM